MNKEQDAGLKPVKEAQETVETVVPDDAGNAQDKGSDADEAAEAEKGTPAHTK